MAALETHRMLEIIQGIGTISGRIRALDEAGFARADIARFLDKRYQHVRNVLTAPTPVRKEAGRNSRVSVEAPVHKVGHLAGIKARVQIGAGGRIVIPAEMRAAMNASEGDTLLARVVDGEFRLLSQKAAVRRAQELVRRHVPEGVSLVDELLEDRRNEARRDSGS